MHFVVIKVYYSGGLILGQFLVKVPQPAEKNRYRYFFRGKTHRSDRVCMENAVNDNRVKHSSSLSYCLQRSPMYLQIGSTEIAIFSRL